MRGQYPPNLYPPEKSLGMDPRVICGVGSVSVRVPFVGRKKVSMGSTGAVAVERGMPIVVVLG